MGTQGVTATTLAKLYTLSHIIAAVLGGLSAILSFKLEDTALMIEVLTLVIVILLSVLTTDVRVLNFSTLVGTWGIAINPTTVTYKPFLQSITTKEILSGKEVIEGQILLVEYDRKNKKSPCSVGGTLYIASQLLSTYAGIATVFLVAHLIYRVV